MPPLNPPARRQPSVSNRAQVLRPAGSPPPRRQPVSSRVVIAQQAKPNPAGPARPVSQRVQNARGIEDFIGTSMWVVNTAVGGVSTYLVYAGRYYKWNEGWHHFKNKPNAYFYQKRFKQLKGVRTIQVNRVSGARNLASRLTKVGGVLVVADIALSGEIKPSHAINAVMLGASTTGVGAIVAGAWFLADFGTMGVNYLVNGEAKGIGDMIDESLGTYEMYDGVY